MRSDSPPFGMVMPNRSYAAGTYRFGFNGKENDNEVKGNNNSIDFGDRNYDPRLGKWFSVDPENCKFPSFSPYNAFNNNPISVIDKKGRGGEGVIVGNEFVIYMHIIFYGDVANQNPALATVTTDKINQQLNSVCTQIMFGDQVYNVRFEVSSEVKTTGDALQAAKENTGNNYDPRLNFITIQNSNISNTNTTAQELDNSNHTDRSGGKLGGDNSARIKLSSVNNPSSTGEVHEVTHWLLGRFFGVHDDGPLQPDELPNIMMTGKTNVDNANPIFTEQLPALPKPTLKTSTRLLQQENIDNVLIYEQKNGNYQVGGATNVLFDEKGNEVKPEDN